ncbi:MAG: type II secretion system protein [Candidatus Spechtbacterales bacterium]
MLNLNKKSSQRGFTMIELIVSMSVITILSSIVFYRSRSGERNFALRRSAQVVLQSVNQAANNTLSGKRHDGTVSQGGYGIHFETGDNFITVFADCNQNNTFDDSGTAPSCVESPDLGVAFPELYRTIQLEPFMRISALEGDSSINQLDITFLPPNALAVIRPLLLSEDEVMIEVENTQEGNVIQIYVNKAGATRMVIP